MLQKQRHHVTATPPPSPTHGQPNASSPVHTGSLLSSMLEAPKSGVSVGGVLDVDSEAMCCLALRALTHLFMWVPINSGIITPALVAAIFRLATVSPDYGREENHNVRTLAMAAINELLYKNCVPSSCADFVLSLLQQAMLLLHHWLQAPPTSEASCTYESKLIEFLQLFVNLHLHRLEEKPQFPVATFAELLLRFTFHGDSLERLLSCLEVWETFLHHLQDKPSITSRYSDVLVSLLRQVLNKCLFCSNQAQLEELDDEDVNDDNQTEWQQFLCTCVDIIDKIISLIPASTYKIVMTCPWKAEQERLHKLLREVEEELEAEDGSSGSPGGQDNAAFPEDEDQEEDNVSESEHETGTEEDADTSDESSEVDSGNANNKYYVGRDKITKWRQNASSATCRTRSHNIVSKLPGVRGSARNALTVMDALFLFFTSDMLENIVENTNERIRKVSASYSDKQRVRETEITELLAVMGLLYLAGVFKSGRQNLRDLWAEDGTGIQIFRLTMSLFRFKFLLQCLRFDDAGTREERAKTDKIAAIRDFFEAFVKNCINNYSLGAYVTIDEKLEAFRGRASFRQYIPSKPSKYGIKIYALVDARMYYTNNLEIYVGNQPEGPYKLSNSPHDVVIRMVAPISGSGRNVTTDNWFTSYPLAISLLQDHKLTLLGTIRKNKREIPPEFSETKGKPIGSSLFGFCKDVTLVSHVPKKGKVVILLSTMHHDAKIDESTGQKKKPEIITDYNLTKGGVDMVDQLSSLYDVSRNSRRWPLTVFFALMNVAGINSQIIFQSNSKSEMNRRTYLKTLGLELVKKCSTERHQVRCLRRELQAKLKPVKHDDKDTQPPTKLSRRSRCTVCPRSKDRKTNVQCVHCKSHICTDHIVPFCRNCAPETTEDSN
ncbi:piggyBac transposable element-derived protein 4-like isoform X4 [Bacillus rossius redtenbacheri]